MRYILSILLLIFQMRFVAQTQTVIKMKKEGGVSIIPCKVNGLNLNFIFDTGASDVSMSLTEANFMLKNGFLRESDFVGTQKYLDASGSINEGIVINLRLIEIAGLEMTNIKASISKNLNAPLLLGQSAISKLGKFQLDLSANILTIFNGQATFNYSDYKKIRSDSLFGIEKMFADAFAKQKQHDYEGALSDYNKILEISPELLNVYYNRGAVKAELQDYNGSISDFNILIKLTPKDADAYSSRANVKSLLLDYPGALKDYNKAIEIDPYSVVAYYNRGRMKYTLNDYKGAIADFNKAIKINSHIAEPYCGRGQVKFDLKDYKGAMADLNMAININPDFDVAYSARGALKYTLQDYRGALADCTKEIEINPNANAYKNRGSIRNILKDFEGAIVDFDRAIRINSNSGQAFFGRGLAKISLGQKDSGCLDLSKAGELGIVGAYEAIKQFCN